MKTGNVIQKKEKDLIKELPSPSKETKNQIEDKLRKAYYLNRSEKRIFSILLWAVFENKKEHSIEYAQISSESINKIMKKRYLKKKGYHTSTISRFIKRLKDHQMIEVERGRDNINRYSLKTTSEWINELANEKPSKITSKKTNKKSNTKDYELYTDKEFETASSTKKLDPDINNNIYKYNIHTIKELDNNKVCIKEDKDKEIEKKCEAYFHYVKRKKKAIRNEEAYKSSMIKLAKKGLWNFNDYQLLEEQEQKNLSLEKKREQERLNYLKQLEKEEKNKQEFKKWRLKVDILKKTNRQKYESYKSQIKITSDILKNSEELIDILISEELRKEG